MRGFIVFIIVVLCLGAIYGFSHDRIADGNYLAVTQGATEAQVLAHMGTPSETNSTCSAYGTTVTGDCDHVLVYRSAFSFATRKHWLFFIDHKGHVADKSMQTKR